MHEVVCCIAIKLGCHVNVMNEVTDTVFDVVVVESSVVEGDAMECCVVGLIGHVHSQLLPNPVVNTVGSAMYICLADTETTPKTEG